MYLIKKLFVCLQGTKTNKMAGRKELPEDEKKIRLIPFIQKKIIDKSGRKECEKIAVEAVVMEYEKLKNI